LTAAQIEARSSQGMLPRYALLGAALAFAGPPIYIHTPALYANQHGMSLAAVGAVLLGLRMLDFIQDPVLGWWIARSQTQKRWLAAGFAVLLAVGALALFAPAPMFDARWWLAISLAAVFTGFSALQIMFYSAGVAFAERPGMNHPQVAGWREAGILTGVSAACVAPSLFGAAVGAEWAFPAFAIAFCALLAIAVGRMHRRWPQVHALENPTEYPGFAGLLRDAKVRRLLMIGLINTLPVGLTATLFLFFVEDLLQAPDHTGPALLLFFVAAAVAAPFWARAARRIGAKWAMLIGMTGAIAAFLWAVTLGAGDWPAFYVICAVSGAALGADMTLLPAMLSERLAARGLSTGHAFGLWGFINKASLAFAAGLALPALDAAGFAPGETNDPAALDALSFAYAGLPCLLKAAAALVLFATPSNEGDAR